MSRQHVSSCLTNAVQTVGKHNTCIACVCVRISRPCVKPIKFSKHAAIHDALVSMDSSESLCHSAEHKVQACDTRVETRSRIASAAVSSCKQRWVTQFEPGSIGSPKIENTGSFIQNWTQTNVLLLLAPKLPINKKHSHQTTLSSAQRPPPKTSSQAPPCVESTLACWACCCCCCCWPLLHSHRIAA